MLVDGQWRIESMLTTETAGESSGLPEVGQQLEWVSVGNPQTSSAPFRGEIRFGDLRYSAIAQPRTKGGYTVVYDASNSFAITRDELTSSLQLAGIITLLWVSAPLGLVIYLIMSAPIR